MGTKYNIDIQNEIAAALDRNNVPYRKSNDGFIEYRSRDAEKINKIVAKVNNESSIRHSNKQINPEINNILTLTINLVNNEKYDVALDKLNNFIKKYPKSSQLVSLRAFVKGAMGDSSGQIADLTLAINLQPDNSNILLNRGAVWARLNNYQKALMDYNKAIEIEPDEIEAFFFRGNALYELGKIDEAVADYHHYINISSEESKMKYRTISPVTHIYLDLLASYYAKSERYEDAANCEERAIDIAILREEKKFLDQYRKRLHYYKTMNKGK